MSASFHRHARRSVVSSSIRQPSLRPPIGWTSSATIIFAVERTPRGTFLRSTPQRSSSGLYTKLEVDGRSLTNVQWTWRVDALQTSGDLRSLATEDSGATIFFVFGEPSFINRDVPTLAYVWSATPVADGTIFNSARFSSLRYIHLHGASAIGTWQSETRNVVRDYEICLRYGARYPEIRRNSE